jgi:DNA repair protein RecO (recombination protein O)
MQTRGIQPKQIGRSAMPKTPLISVCEPGPAAARHRSTTNPSQEGTCGHSRASFHSYPSTGLHANLNVPLMPARVSEAIVLQTYAFSESDLIVSFLARDVGKLRGVAKRARKPKSSFGAGLERLSHVKMQYVQRENRDLVSLYSCDLLQSQFGLMQDYAAGISLDFFAEVAEHLLPENEANEKFFRLLLTVLEHMHSAEPGAVWRAVTYFSLWSVKLSGLLPDLPVSQASLDLAEEIQRLPVAEVAPGSFVKENGRDLRRFLVHQLESHVERKLKTVPVLESA